MLCKLQQLRQLRGRVRAGQRHHLGLVHQRHRQRFLIRHVSERGSGFASIHVRTQTDAAALTPLLRKQLQTIDTALPFVHRRLADGDSYFIVNRKGRAESVEAHFRVTGKKPELWNAETGAITPVPKGVGDDGCLAAVVETGGAPLSACQARERRWVNGAEVITAMTSQSEE